MCMRRPNQDGGDGSARPGDGGSPGPRGSVHSIRCRRTGEPIAMKLDGGICACDRSGECIMVADLSNAREHGEGPMNFEPVRSQKPDPVIADVLAEVADCAAECATHSATPWTALPIVYDNTVGDVNDSVRLELDAWGSGRLTVARGGRTVVLDTDSERLYDLEHLILRGLNRYSLEQRKGWAA